jgi:hypothetical protein
VVISDVEEPLASLFRVEVSSEDGYNVFFWNVGTIIKGGKMMSQSRKLRSLS